MEKRSFMNRFIIPVLIVFVVMSVSWIVYNLSWRLDNDTIHQLLADISGTLLFISITFGVIVVYSMAFFRRASLLERVIASFVNPAIWVIKEVFRMFTSFSITESLYFAANPLVVWLVLGTITQMGLLEIILRWRLKRRGEKVKVFNIPAILAFALGLFLVIVLYAWGRGENVFSFYLEMYRAIFGAGVGI
ncbi:MAG: hypothetical protein JW984_10885 [Deltaproteobacteria bacterium]|uniref:Uncharacterized protein n=1 Tax=Candidatus Zymogenus saltonus TaxID=2844893 RepID=A0A9D8KGE4_9DELT|nr:hypothetical protein [Candidatus Zymogenus saltonus]